MIFIVDLFQAIAEPERASFRNQHINSDASRRRRHQHAIMRVLQMVQFERKEAEASGACLGL
jgi:hypothetical protein